MVWIIIHMQKQMTRKLCNGNCFLIFGIYLAFWMFVFKFWQTRSTYKTKAAYQIEGFFLKKMFAFFGECYYEICSEDIVSSLTVGYFVIFSGCHCSFSKKRYTGCFGICIMFETNSKSTLKIKKNCFRKKNLFLF